MKKVMSILYLVTVLLSGCIPTSPSTPTVTLPTTPAKTLTPTSLPEPTPTSFSTPALFITDLDGNRDIQESDSLTIKFYNTDSDISTYKYQWLRNGFLIEDANNIILPNEIMKTFVGIPGENTPASSHTDHTIRGYQYKVIVNDSDGNVIGSDEIKIIGKLASIDMRGVHFVTWESWQTINGKGAKSLEAMQARLNPNWVKINTIHFQNKWEEPAIISLPSGDPSTVPDNLIIEQINKAHELGLKVILYPEIWLASGTPWGRADELVPSKEWFEAYKNSIVQQAIIAENTQTEILVIGVELETTVMYEKEWREIITEIRKHYSGLITYSPIVCCEGQVDSLKNITWFDELDFIGLSANLEYREGGFDVRLTDLVNYFEKRAAEFESLALYFNKPVILLETNASAADGATMGPWKWDRNTADYQEQADYFDAFLRVYGNKDWVKGIFFLNWLSSQETWYYEIPVCPTCTEFINKPAEYVLASWYGAR